MSGLLDLYLEKLTAKMNLDEVQRAKVEKELRSHLEEAVQNLVQSGHLPEAAEKEAIGAFGQPSLIARQFGIVSGTGWLIFERCSLAAVWMLPILLNVFPFLKRSDPSDHLDLFTAAWIGFIVLVLIITGSLWPKIEVNGALRIRRFLKRSLAIPFDKVHKVSFQKGHLFGKHCIEVAYEGGKAVLGPDNRNFRCAAIALNVLARDAVDEEVRDYIAAQLSLNPQPEGWLFRSLLSLYWVLPVSFLAISWPDLWSLRGVPASFFYAWLLVFVGTVVQGNHHKNRAKRGVCWLLIVWLVFVGALNAFLLVFGECVEIRWVLTADAILFFIPLLILWWPGSRLQLVAVCVVLMVASWFVRGWIPSTWDGPVKMLDLMGRFPNEIQCFGTKGEQIACLNGFLGAKLLNQPSELTVLGGEALPFHKTLDPELTWMLLDSPSNDYVAVKGFRGLDKNSVSTEILAFDRKGESVASVSLSPPLHIEGYLSRHTSVCFSPDMKHLLVGQPVHAMSQTHEYMLGVYDIAGGATISLAIPENLIPVHWLDERRLVALEYIPEATGKMVAHTYTGVRVWTVDIGSGSGKVDRELPLPEASSPHALEGGEFLYLDKGKPEPFQINPPRGIALFNLETGYEAILPDHCEGSFIHQDLVWSSTSKRLAYLSGTKTQRCIVVADPEGVVATLPLDPSGEVDGLEISPDGRKIFLVEQFNENFYSSFSHLRVWDVDRNLCCTVRAYGFMADGLLGAFSQRRAVWSPDSRCLAYTDRKAICVVDVEAWAENAAKTAQ